jgi:4-oxalocrotonate tautomerase
MPILNVKVSAQPSAELARSVSDTLVDITTRVLRKNRDVTAVAIDFVPEEHWIIAGKSLAEHKKKSFYFDIKVVEGTNTKDEKSEYIRQVFAAFERILGDLHPESYVYVQEVRADAYGYGGVTQEYRYIDTRARRT